MAEEEQSRNAHGQIGEDDRKEVRVENRYNPVGELGGCIEVTISGLGMFSIWHVSKSVMAKDVLSPYDNYIIRDIKQQDVTNPFLRKFIWAQAWPMVDDV